MREARDRMHLRRDLIKCLAPCAGTLRAGSRPTLRSHGRVYPSMIAAALRDTWAANPVELQSARIDLVPERVRLSLGYLNIFRGRIVVRRTRLEDT